MRRTLASWSLALAGSVAVDAAAAAAAPPPWVPFAASFRGHKRVMLFDARADATVQLRRSASHAVYTIDTEVRWAVVSRRFVDCSVMRVDGSRLTPLEYMHRDPEQPEHDIHTTFDWAAKQAVSTLGDGRVRRVELDGPSWDPLSFQLALMAAAPLRDAGEVDRYTVIERGALKVHRVVFAAPTEAAGNGLPVRSDKEGGGAVSLLLDPARHHQPLRIAVDDVALDRYAERPAPAPLAAGEVPRCESVP